METMVYLYVYLQKNMDAYAESTGRALLLKIAQANANLFTQQQANTALGSLVQNCSPGRVLNALLNTGLRWDHSQRSQSCERRCRSTSISFFFGFAAISASQLGPARHRIFTFCQTSWGLSRYWRQASRSTSAFSLLLAGCVWIRLPVSGKSASISFAGSRTLKVPCYTKSTCFQFAVS